METTWKRLVVIAVLGASIAGGVVGLAVVLGQSESRSDTQLRGEAHQRAALAADLIDSVLSTSRQATLTPSRTATFDRYLREVAGFAAPAGAAHTYLVNGPTDVIAVSSPSSAVGKSLAEVTRPVAPAGAPGALRAGGQSPTFITSAAVSGTPWRVVYSIPTRDLGGGGGSNWGLSFALLACFGTAAVACLFLLIRLFSRTGQLAGVNRALAQRNGELQAASEAKSRFVATMSHELRNPLNAVIGFAELMHDGRLGPLAPGQRKHLGVIRSSAEHLLALINDFLDMARIEAGHIRLEPEPIEPASIAAECATSLGRLAAAKTIHIDLDPRPLGTVMVDPGRLRQLLLNYLSNAIKFSGEGTTVRIWLERDGNELRIAVADQGPGIDPADQSRLFEEFFQAANRDRTGTGLGLSITKRIVEAQGGTVGVRSTPGRGSTFYATLPAPAVPEPGRATPDPFAATSPRDKTRPITADKNQVLAGRR